MIDNILITLVIVTVFLIIAFIVVKKKYLEHIKNTSELFTFSDISQPITVNQIKSWIIATDYRGKDLTNRIKIHEDNYTNNKLIVGDHKIVFEVSDDHNSKSYLSVTVRVKDILSKEGK